MANIKNLPKHEQPREKLIEKGTTRENGQNIPGSMDGIPAIAVINILFKK